jgi:hypothetical protein
MNFSKPLVMAPLAKQSLPDKLMREEVKYLHINNLKAAADISLAIKCIRIRVIFVKFLSKSKYCKN